MEGHSRPAFAALLLLPGALTVYLSFNAGGFFANTHAFAALVLVAAMILRVAFARAPFAGYGWSLAFAGGALALYALWTALSGVWSDAPGRAALELDRALLYLFALLLFGSLTRSSANLRLMVYGLAAAIVIVCACGLVTRILPDVWPVDTTLANERLSYPLTYWNALGLLAAVGTILCFHVTASRSQPAAARVVAAAAVPALVTTLFFTFSRGAIAAGVIGLVIYVVVARPRALLTGALATVPAGAIAIVVAYDADLLATAEPTTQAAVDQGHGVAIAVLACTLGAALVRWLALRLDRGRATPAPSLRVVGIAAGAGAVLAIALGAPAEVADQYDRFVEGGQAGKGGDLRTRLTDPANNGRLDLWNVSLDAFAAEPLTGHGAGTYHLVWARDRPLPAASRDAHSLYAEVLGELGVVGFLLLVATLAVIVVMLAARAGGRNRTLYAALLAVIVTWMVHAGVDWDWEMPAVTLWVFALGGAALARADAGNATDADARTGTAPRIAAIAACSAVALVPGIVLVSQERLDHSADAFTRGDCRTAVDAASSAIAALALRPEPYEVRAFCRLREGRTNDALRDLQRARERDPESWTYRYDLAVARAYAGLDPRPQAHAALRLNPLNRKTQRLVRRFGTGSPQRWKTDARSLFRGSVPFYFSDR